MSVRRILWVAVCGAALLGLALVPLPSFAAGFVWATAPIAGSVLLLAIGRVTAARWGGYSYFRPVWWLLVPAAVLLGVSRVGDPLPAHLALWQSGWAVAVRGGLFALLLAGGGWFVTRRPGASAAAVLLALYAIVVTPIAYDWLMGGVPGHAASAAGMMLAVQQIGGGAALGIIASKDEPLRRDLAKLCIAAALGLGYLAFVDYLIIWYSDLPQRVPFYALRGSTGAALVAAVALVIGLGGAIVGAALQRENWVAVAVLVGSFLFDVWWIAPSFMSALIAAATALLLMQVGLALLPRREARGG